MGRDAGGKVTSDGAAGGISVGSWDCCMLPHIETGNGLNKLRTRIEIGVSDAAVLGPKAGVHGKLREVGEPRLPTRSSRRAAWDGGEGAQVDGFGAFEFQVSLQEGGVALLVVRVVMDVLCHVAIENRKRG